MNIGEYWPEQYFILHELASFYSCKVVVVILIVWYSITNNVASSNLALGVARCTRYNSM